MLKTYDITRRKSRPTKKSKIMLTPTTGKLDPITSIPIEQKSDPKTKPELLYVKCYDEQINSKLFSTS